MDTLTHVFTDSPNFSLIHLLSRSLNNSLTLGKYTCVRKNEAGELEGSAWLSVLVRTQIFQPPTDTKEPIPVYNYSNFII